MKLISQVLLGLLAVQGGCVGQDEYATPDTGATSDVRDDAKQDIIEVLDDPDSNEPDANHDAADQDPITNHDIAEDIKDAETGEDADFDPQDFDNRDLMGDSEISDLSDLADIHDIPDREDVIEDVINDVDVIDVSSPDVMTDAAIDMDTSDLVTDADIDTNTDADEDADVDAGEVQISGYDRCLAQYNAIVEQSLRDHPPDPEPEPTQEPPDTFTQVSLGQSHGCALRTNGSIYCWGNNQYHQSEPPPEDHFVQVVAYENQSCALDALGHLRCWGENREDFVEDRYEFSKLSKGCGLLTNGSIQCWTQYNRLGLQSVPGQFIDVSYNDGMLCAIDNQNKLQCFGNIFENRQIVFPHAYSSLPRNNFISLKVMPDSICAETEDHYLICRGESTPGPNNLPIEHYALSPDNSYGILIYNDGSLEIENYDGQINRFIDPNFTALSREGWADVDINGAQHCAIDQNQQLQCWTNHGSRKQNLLYDRFLDYDFGCSIMQDHSLFCEEGYGDNFSRNTNILFDSIDTRGLNMAISVNQDVYYFENTYEGEPNEYDLYYFQGPFENIINVGPYFCEKNEHQRFDCHCVENEFQNLCNESFQERSLFFIENFHQINKGYFQWNENCGIDFDGNIACWQNSDPNTVHVVSEEQFIYGDFFYNNYCGITCEGHLKCFGEYIPFHREDIGIYKNIVGAYSSVCGIMIDNRLKCFGTRVASPIPNGSFVKVLQKYDTACAQRENGSVVCWGYTKGGK